MSATALIRADHLDVDAATAPLLRTQVASISVATAAAGSVAIAQTAGVLRLSDIRVLDGALTVTAPGTIVAEKVRSQTDRETNDITLTSTAGDIQVGYVVAGTYAPSADEADAVRLRYFNGALRSIGVLDAEDPDWTLAQARSLNAGSYASFRRSLNTELRGIFNDPAFKAKWLEIGSEPVADTPEEFAAFIQSEARKMGPLIKALDVHLD